MLFVKHVIRDRDVYLIGPNSPGIITPGIAKIGIIPGSITKKENVGVVSRSGTLTYEVVYALKEAGLGTSTCVGIGGDSIIGTNFINILSHFEGDSQTDVIVMIGEIGGTEEENAASYIANNMTKPVVGFIAGQAAPQNKRMGHAGAIIESGMGDAEGKIRALRNAGVQIAKYPDEIPALIKNI